jgi:2-amino-4-hydroxy-6-hydroxymethyldihydropteridine diphosphokinase
MTSAVTCYIGLGSNLGDRLSSLQRASALIGATPGIRLKQPSAVYESVPWGYVDQPAFLNAVVALETTLGPVQLFLRLQLIERALGRQRRFRWGPREIDLDLLLYDGAAIARRGLTVPHPAIDERPFVLLPLRDVFPDYRSRAGESIDRLIGRGDPDGRLARRLLEAPTLFVR